MCNVCILTINILSKINVPVPAASASDIEGPWGEKFMRSCSARFVAALLTGSCRKKIQVVCLARAFLKVAAFAFVAGFPRTAPLLCSALRSITILVISHCPRPSAEENTNVGTSFCAYCCSATGGG